MPTFRLVAGADVTFGLTGNSLGDITSIAAVGRTVTLASSSAVTQSGAIVAASFALESLAAVTLGSASNDVDAVGIKASGAVTFVDRDDLTLGVGGVGIAALGSPVTVTTTGNLTQLTNGQVVAATFTANINNPISGVANLNLDSTQNQVATFVGKNNSAGGDITFVNAAVGGALTLGDGTGVGGVTAINGAISINNTGAGITLASPVSAGSLGTISLTSRGAISQNAAPTAAILTAADLTVVNSDTTGAVTLDQANNVRKVAITNNATATAGITFKGSNSATGSLEVGVGGQGISAQGGIVKIDANGRKLVINAPITGVNTDVSLTAALGVSQGSAAGIVANELTVVNVTSGVVALESPNNDVANLAISNNVASGTVKYAEKNDLSLTAGGGVVAGDSISLTVGGGFTSTPGNVLQVTGKTGQVSLTTEKTATIGGAVTSPSGVTVKAGSVTTVAGIVLTAAVQGGTGPVSLAATGALATSGAISGASVALAGDASVALAAAVNAIGGSIAIDSSAGPLNASAAGALTASTSIVAKVAGDATFSGAVNTGGAINVTAGNATNASDINVNAAFTAGGSLTLDATDAITASAAITAASITGKSVGATTLGATASSTGGAVTFTSGGAFASTATGVGLSAVGSIAVTSGGGLSLQGTAIGGTQVTLAAGTATSPGSVTLASAVEAKAGNLQVSAVGGAVAAGALATLTAPGGDIFVSGEKSASLGAAATAKNVSVTAAAGAVLVNKVTAIGNVTLSAANGVSQAAGTAISALMLITSNTTNGGIGLVESDNAVGRFSATNTASGTPVTFVNKQAVILEGISTNNGLVEVTANGSVGLTGGIAAGTGNVSLTAAGTVSQTGTAAIIGANLGVVTTVGDVLLGVCRTNDVDLIYGSTAGGKFEFTDTDGLGVTSVLNPLNTDGGAITIDSGEGGAGAMTIGGAIAAGAGLITLEAGTGIVGLASHAITSTNGLALANNVSGDINLSSLVNSFPQLSAVNAGGDITVVANVDAMQLVKHALTAGLQAGGAIVLKVLGGSLEQDADAPVIAKNATFTTEGTVALGKSNLNDVVNLAIQNTGSETTIDYVDADDLFIGVGGSGVVSLAGDITLAALTGQMTLGDVVTTSSTSNTVSLEAVGILQTKGAITTGNLIMASSNSIDVVQAGNSITNLRATAAGFLDFDADSSFETGLDGLPVPPDPAITTVAVTDNSATFDQPFTVNGRSLSGGDVLVIDGVPYRVKSVTGLNAELISPDGQPANFADGTSFGVLSPKEIAVAAGAVRLNSGGTLRVVGGIGGSLTLTAGGVVEYVVSSTENAAGGSLRQMIGYLNSNLGRQIINNVPAPQPSQMVFNEQLYPVQDIFVTASLPAIQRPIDIIGEQVEAHVTDYQRVGIDGTGVTAASIVHGLRFAAGSQESRVSGLAVYGFDTGSGFQITSGLNTLVNNYAGIRRDGVSLEGNSVGIEMTGITATTNTIGTYLIDESLANVVGGNIFAGIFAGSNAAGNAIVGNYIGTDSAGRLLGNLGDGVVFEAVNGNLIGTRTAGLSDGTPAASNVIANNNKSGVRIVNARAASLSLGNLIENNRIAANGIHGVEITGSTFQAVGGSQPRQANVITGQSTGSGVRIAQSGDVSVVANYIGTDSFGAAGLGNADAGVMIEGSARTIVAGGNRIGSNATGVTVRGSSTATRVEGNWIGTDSEGTPLGNTFDGVRIDRSIGNFVRAGNTIANNGVNGVNITDAMAAAVGQGNQIVGNLITSNGDFGAQTGAGIRVAGGGGHRLGLLGSPNVIVANGGEGILVERSQQTGSSVGVVIQANYIGTNANEDVDESLGNQTGIRLSQANSVTINWRNVIANNRVTGVRLQGTSNSQVGGTTAGMGNAIFGNLGEGITITSTVPGVPQPVRNSGNSVFGNQISGNGDHGVLVQGVSTNGASTTSNVVVGVSPIPGRPITGAANAIFGNLGDGVRIDGAQGVLVAGNSIYENVGLPIAIVNGGNQGAAAPTLTRAVLVQPSNAAPQVAVEGTFATTGSGTVTVVNGQATFSQAQPTLAVGGVITVNGVGHTIAQKISNTVFRLSTNATLTVAGTGRVAATKGTATFSVPQASAIVGQSIVVAGRAYTVLSLSANGRTARLAGSPTFTAASFAISQPFGFGVISPSVLNQQFVVDVFLNDPATGNPADNTGYGMQTFIGRITVTVTAANAGRFSGVLNLPAGLSAVGQYITATATTMRASNLAAPNSTSEVSKLARQLVFAGPGR
jgi:hypothetical protein